MTTRTEHDTFGPIAVPAERLWGAQTQRSLRFFQVSNEVMPKELVHALARVKRAAATVNARLAGLDATKADAIARAADEVLAGRHDAEFPLSVWQTGSGTQTNMNVNGCWPTAPRSCSAGRAAKAGGYTPTTTSTEASRPTAPSPPRCTSPRPTPSPAGCCRRSTPWPRPSTRRRAPSPAW